MEINELSIRKANDVGHMYDLIICHPSMEYIGILGIGLLNSAPNFQRQWPIERQHSPTFTLAIGLIKSVQALSFNNWYSNRYDITNFENKFYYDICFYLTDCNIGIAINLILNQIAIIDVSTSSYSTIDINDL